MAYPTGSATSWSDMSSAQTMRSWSTAPSDLLMRTSSGYRPRSGRRPAHRPRPICGRSAACRAGERRTGTRSETRYVHWRPEVLQSHGRCRDQSTEAWTHAIRYVVQRDAFFYEHHFMGVLSDSTYRSVKA
jgi:hypothetical protein